MSGIRVSWIHNNCTEKEIKIYFSKQDNGGGRIQCIYYPMFNGDAVVLFEDKDTADRVTSMTDHTINGKDYIGVTKLPAQQVFPVLEAKLDASVAALLQTDDRVREELEYHFYSDNIEFIRDKDGNIEGIRGNWYLLEWTWAYINMCIEHQSEITFDDQRPMLVQTQRNDIGTKNKVDVPIISMPSGKSHKDTNGASSTKPDKEMKSSPVVDKDEGGTEDEVDKQLALLDISETKGTHDDKKILIKDNEENVSSLQFTYGSLTISVYIGWITMAETDAIVNAAMGTLKHAGGVAGAIAKAASPQMQRQCDEYVDKHGSLRVGEVMHTCAGGEISNCVKYILHAVGPFWSPDEETRCFADLTKTFLKCLTYANDHLKLNTITFPLISSGIFGMPLELCVQSFQSAIILFPDQCDNVCLREVHLVNNNDDNTALTVLHLRSLISHGANKLLTEAKLLLSSVSTTKLYQGRYTRSEPRVSLFEEDDVKSKKSSTKTDYSSGSSMLCISGQKLSTESDHSDYREKNAGPSTASYLHNRGGARGSGLSSAAGGYNSRSSDLTFADQNTGSSHITGGTYTTGFSSSLRSSGTTKQSKSTEITTHPPTTSYLYSEEEKRLGLPVPSSSMRSSSASQSRSGDTTRQMTTGRPLPDLPHGVIPFLSKRY